MTPTMIEPVLKSIAVNASPERALEVFTAEHDGWWPRKCHVGQSPMIKSHIECHLGGRCYSYHQDGSQCDWGRVLVWEPPHRLVLAWRVTHEWRPNPDLAQASEVEVRALRPWTTV